MTLTGSSVLQVPAVAQDDTIAAPAATKNMFDAARNKRRKAAAPTTDELDHYLAAEPDPTINNALAWWCSPERRTLYPRLSRMARCYLTIPRKYSNISSALLVFIT